MYLLCLTSALFARALTQCNIKELLNNIGSSAAAPAAAPASSAAPVSEAKEEKKEDKKEESESEDEDMGFGKDMF